MVNYDSISMGLEVEFQLDNEIYDGIVRFKGPVNGKEGVWVGVETIQEVGNCDGRLNGRSYFKAPPNHGLFINSDELRLSTKRRKKCKNKLYKSTKGPGVDESLFKSCQSMQASSNVDQDELMVCISKDYLTRAKSAFASRYDIMPRQKFHATREWFVTDTSKQNNSNNNVSTSNSNNSFQPTRSIPKSFMPEDELKLYTKLDWSYKNVSLPNNSNLNNTFDSFNKKRSNYIA